jgi:hypothetical protein
MMLYFKITALVFGLMIYIPLIGQIDTVFRVEVMKKTRIFASLTIGLDMMAIGKGSFGSGSSQVTTPAQFRPGITIGGVHFWGHADFYVTFPIGPNFGKRPENTTKFVNRESVKRVLNFILWP